MDKAERYLGIMRKAGKLVLGETACGAAVRAGKARALLLAADAAPNARRRAETFVYGRGTPLICLPYTKETIAARAGGSVCAMAAVTDIGLAAAFTAALAEQDAQTYGAAAAQLEAQRGRIGKRRKNV